MKKKIFQTIIVIAILFLGCNTRTSVLTSDQDSIINVKDFGAKGDGMADDTQAIQKAVDSANKSRISLQKKGYFGEQLPYTGSSPTVYFPIGQYYITETIKVGSFVNLEGESSLIFTDKKEVIAIRGSCWQSKIEALQFIGFEKALSMNSKNVDQGKVLIENCVFLGNKLAIEIQAQSSLVHISKCRFSNNEKSISVRSDKTIVESNWIKSGVLKGDQPAQIDAYGMLHFDRNLLVPRPPDKGAIEPAWINNYGSVIVTGTRQGGETGSFTLINNFSKLDNTYPINQNAVVVRDSDCYAVFGNRKGYRQPAVVRLFELPNQVELNGIRGLVDATLIDYSETVPIQARNENSKHSSVFIISSIIKYGKKEPHEFLPNYFKSFLSRNSDALKTN